jgi:hypothetical protein
VKYALLCAESLSEITAINRGLRNGFERKVKASDLSHTSARFTPPSPTAAKPASVITAKGGARDQKAYHIGFQYHHFVPVRFPQRETQKRTKPTNN